MPEFIRVWGNNGIREVPVIQGVQEIVGSRNVNNNTNLQVISRSNIPFVVMPGDGSANGCQFTGTAGAFTLSTAILTGVYTALTGCYVYLPANFGGSTRSAGWYWAQFSSDTAGIVYTEQYTGGVPSRVTSPTAFTENLTGWVTGVTTEITIDTILLPGNVLGKNGRLQMWMHQSGTTSGYKTYRIRDSATTAWMTQTTGTSPSYEQLVEIVCLGNHISKQAYRSFGSLNTTQAANAFDSVSTGNDQLITLTIQQATNVAAAILLSYQLVAWYGE